LKINKKACKYHLRFLSDWKNVYGNYGDGKHDSIEVFYSIEASSGNYSMRNYLLD
jgi:hypothetical protein